MRSHLRATYHSYRPDKRWGAIPPLLCRRIEAKYYGADGIDIIITVMVIIHGIISMKGTHINPMTMTLHRTARMSLAMIMLIDYRDALV